MVAQKHDLSDASYNRMWFYTEANNIEIVSYDEKCCQSLFEIVSDETVNHLIAPNFEKISFEKFKNKLERRIKHRWEHYRVIIKKDTKEVIGFFYFYDSLRKNRTAKVNNNNG